MIAKKRMDVPRKKLWGLLFIGMFAIFAISSIYREVQRYRIINLLKRLEPQQVTLFRLYAKDIPTEFTATDPIVAEFVQSMKDLHSYWGGRYTTSMTKGGWFLDMIIRGRRIQMICILPAEKRDVVIGTIEIERRYWTTSYGEFQSKLLYDWYQKYSHRWLTPAAPPDATAAPTPP